MDTKLLHVRDKLELIIRFMMAGDGSFKARLSEAYRHPQYGLRQVPINFMPAELQKSFTELLDNIDKNEKSKVLNDVKMTLMDEVFFFYKKVCSYISGNVFSSPEVVEQSDIVMPEKKTRAKKVKK